MFYSSIETNLTCSNIMVLYFKYFLWLLQEIVLSSIAVTKIIWSRHCKIDDVMQFIPIDLEKNISRVLLANSITLTPGTITVFLGKDKILVHSLTKEGLNIKTMQDKIRETLEC